MQYIVGGFNLLIWKAPDLPKEMVEKSNSISDLTSGERKDCVSLEGEEQVEMDSQKIL